VKSDYDADDMKIVADGPRLRRVGKKLDLATVNGESIGMMVFRGDGVRLFRDRLDLIVRRSEGLGRWYLSAIDELAQEDRVGICPIHGLSWCEVDDARDLARADAVVRTWPGADDARKVAG
jgi:choline kinase